MGAHSSPSPLQKHKNQADKVAEHSSNCQNLLARAPMQATTAYIVLLAK